MRVAVLLPAFNEERNIAAVVHGVRDLVIEGAELEPLVVNDGSKDATADVAKAAGATVLSHPQNRGVGAAFRTGIEEARRRGHDLLVHMDSDGQFDARDIARVVEPVKSGRCDLALGSRFMRGEPLPPNLDRWKGLALHLIARGVGLLTRAPLTDLSCGLRCMNRRLLEVVSPSFDYDYIQETLLQALAVGARVEDVPVSPLYEAEPVKLGMSSRTLRYGSRFLGMTAFGLAHYYRVRARRLFSVL